MLPFKIESAEERARRRAATLAAKTVAPNIPAVAPPRRDPNLDAIYANHNAERASRGLAPDNTTITPIATTESDPTVVFRGGRPDTAYGQDDLEAKLALKKSIDEQEPQKAKGLKKWLPILLQAGGVVGGIASRDSRAAAQSAYGLGQSLANPRMADENWKRGKQAEVGAEIDDIYKQQDRAADTAYRAAQTRKLNAPAAEKPKRLQLRLNKDRRYVPIDLDTGLDLDGKPVEGVAPQGNEWGIRMNAEGKFVPVNNKTGLDQNGNEVYGANLIRQPDGSLVPSTAVFTKNKQVEDDIRSVEQKNEAAKQKNAQFEAQKKEWTFERDQLDRALKSTPQMVKRTRANPVSGVEEEIEIENPVYNDYMTRRRTVNDKIVGIQMEPILKPPVKPTVVTSGRAKIPAKTNRAQQLKELGIL